MHDWTNINRWIRRHCADAVVSFAVKTVMVGSISARLLEFTALWVQTPSGYDFLVARALGSEWVERYLPVISRGAEHVLYTRLEQVEPSGRLLECPLRCDERLMVLEIRKEKARIECPHCKSRCSVEIVKKDTSTVLGRCDIVKVEYPRQRHMATWESKEDREVRIQRQAHVSTSRSTDRPPALTSRSATLPPRVSTPPPITIATPPVVVLPREDLRIPSKPAPSSLATPDVPLQAHAHPRSAPNLGALARFYPSGAIRQPKRPSPRGEESASKKKR